MTGEPIVTAAQIRAAEQALFDDGLDPCALMERAGAACTDLIWRVGHRREALILCGPGNNGGDGFVIARLLRERGVNVRVAVTGPSFTDQSLRARNLWNGPVVSIRDATPAHTLVDAMFGIGLKRGLDDALSSRLRALVDSSSLSIAIDVPSGLDADSGACLSPTPTFDLCLALGAFKPAHFLQPAAGHMRRTKLLDIGVAVQSRWSRLQPPHLATPGADAHKYSRGLVAIIGGGMPGASLLASHAAARSGAGAVRRFAQEPVADGMHAVIHRHVGDGDALADALSDTRIGAVLAGPGLGLDADAASRLDAAIKAGHPLVLDADALTIISRDRRAIPPGTIITPHEGEFQRLFGSGVGDKINRALAAATASGAIVVYKGPDTVIAAPDGRVSVHGGASSWLSTAGTGDVLAGLAAGRLAVTGDAFRAACESVWLHSDAARRCGAAFVADDLIDALPAAIAARL